jgi:hypothetical protein
LKAKPPLSTLIHCKSLASRIWKRIRLLQQGLPLPSVLGTDEDFQQIVQVAFDAFTQHEAVVARKSTCVMAGPQDQVVGLGDDN